MPKWLKYFLGLFAFATLLMFSIALYAYYNIDKLKQVAVAELNKNLKATVTAKFIDVSFWNTFPEISLTFNQVLINDYLRSDKKLLEADQLHLGFNIIQLLNGNYLVQTISLNKATLLLYENKKGLANYLILKETKPDTNNYSIKLKSIALNECTIAYVSALTKTKSMAICRNANLSGNFSSQEFEMKSAMQLDSVFFEQQNQVLAKNQSLALQTNIKVNSSLGVFSFDNTQLTVNKLMLNTNGELNFKNNAQYNVSFKTNQVSIQELTSVLPFKLPDQYYAYNSEGNVYLNGTLSNTGKMPVLKLNFGIARGTLTEPESKLKITNIESDGFAEVHLNSPEKSFLKLEKLNANLQGNPLKASLSIKTFNQPFINAQLNTTLDLNFLRSYFKLNQIQEVDGNAIINLKLNGSASDFKQFKFGSDNTIDVSTQINKLKLLAVKQPLSNIVLNANLSSNKLLVKALKGQFNQSAIVADGYLLNWLDWFNPNKPVQVFLNAETNFLNLEDWMVFNNNSNTASDTKEDKSLNYELYLQLSANEFVFKNFKATNIKTSGLITPTNIQLSNFNLSTCGGSATCKLQFAQVKNEYVLGLQQVNLKQINITQLLTSFNNFGQTEITDKNLKGNLTANLSLISKWDNNFNFIPQSLYAFAQVEVLNGELNNYEPMQALAKFAEVSDLNNIKFADLKNDIEIKNQKIFIPQMEVKNNAINLSLSGTHSFDNYLDYKCKIRLSELLKKKRSVKQNEFGEEDAQSNGLNLFLNIKGYANNLKISYDKLAVKEKVKQDFTKERKNIADVFKAEFGIGKKDSSVKKMEKQNNNDELEFEIE